MRGWWVGGGPWPRPVRILLLAGGACRAECVCVLMRCMGVGSSATGGRCDKREEE